MPEDLRNFGKHFGDVSIDSLTIEQDLIGNIGGTPTWTEQHTFNSGLAMAEGQEITDGTNTRLLFSQNNTSLRDESGVDIINLESGSEYRIAAGENTPFRVRDLAAGSTAIQYDASATGAGVLSMPRSHLDMQNKDISTVSNFKMQDSNSDGNEWTLYSSGSAQLVWEYGDSAHLISDSLNGRFEVRDLDVRLSTGHSITDGDGNPRLKVDSFQTMFASESGKRRVRASDDSNLVLYGDENADIRFWDDYGSFAALKYLPSSSAPGTLELENATLDANENNITNVRSSGHSTVVSGTDYEIQKDGTDGDGIINFKTS